MTWPLVGFSAVVAFFAFTIIWSAFATSAFRAWLDQRERERLSSTDKAELLRRFEAVDGKLLELKNSALNNRR